MNKKIFALVTLFCSLALFYSCGNDDDTGIDEEWKAYNEQQIRDIINSKEYKSLKSESGNGSVYWKEDKTFIPDDPSNPMPEEDKIQPIFTDTVLVRYTGWYLLKDGTKYEFDSTEGSSNAQAGRKFVVNQLVDGWTTMLTNMKAGDQVEVCIPYQLGYGIAGSGNILPYTTLRFKMKLLKVYKSGD